MTLYVIENSTYRFSIDPDQAQWSLYGLSEKAPSLEGVSMQIVYRRGKTKFKALDRWSSNQFIGPETATSVHGSQQFIKIITGEAANGLRFNLSFALPENQPLFLWNLSIENDGSNPIFLERIELLQAGPVPGADSMQRKMRPAIRNLEPELAFFSNGWQSWNFSGSYGPRDRYRRTRLGALTLPMRVNAGTPRPKVQGHFVSSLFGVLGSRSSRTAILAGMLSEQDAFGTLEARIDSADPYLRLWAHGDGIRLDPGAHFTTDWACLYFLDVDAPDPLGPYLQAVARQNGLPADLPGRAPGLPKGMAIPVGWSSWYQFYNKVSAEDIRRNLQTAASLNSNLPLQLIQIDDGFESALEDWFTFKPTFPEGVAPLAQEIRATGFTPGLWLAPFIIHPRSKLAREHPDWLLRRRFNRPVNAGFGLWDAFSTALDLTHPGALDYTRRVIHTAVHTWGFPYLKLDFLYVAALPGRPRDPTRTRAQILRSGLQALRDAAGAETTLLGCGCPLGPAIGLLDAMRIGADVSDRWLPSYQGREFFFHAEPDYPAARNAIQNTLTRSSLHRRWWINDPDALLLRPEAHLTTAEMQTLATVIVMSGGSLLLSDDLSHLPPERLRIARSLLPLIGERPRLMDWFDSTTPSRLRLDLQGAAGPWHLLAHINWQDHPQDLVLRLADFGFAPDAAYRAREFWSAKTYTFENNELTLKNVAAHGTVLLALRAIHPGLPAYLGSDLHISQGLEVASWDPTPDGLELGLSRPGQSDGTIALYLPEVPSAAWLNAEALHWDAGDQGAFQFTIEFKTQAQIRIDY